MDVLPGDTLCIVLQSALCLLSLPNLRLVSRRWAGAVCRAESWADKDIILWNADIDRESLIWWWPVWRMSKCVCLTCLQWDTYPYSPPSRYAVWCDWGTWNASSSDEWHPVCILGDDSLVCLSRVAVPDSFCLYQVESFWTAVMIGWTTARTPCQLELMFDRWYRSELVGSDQIAWTKIYVVHSREAEEVRQERQDAEEVGASFVHYSLFGQEDWEIAQLQLDRGERALRISTSVTGTQLLPLTLEAPVRPGAALKFFIVIPAQADYAPLPSAMIVARSP